MADWEGFALAVVVGILIGLVLGSASQNSTISGLNTEVTDLKGNLYLTQSALNQSLRMQENLLGNYSRTQRALNAPGVNSTILIWTIPEPLKPKGLVEWFLLDDFVNYVNVSTNGTANYLLLSPEAFGNFTHAYAYIPIDNYTGMHYQRVERLSQGCSGYVLVIRNTTNSTELVIPDINVAYQPTPFLTGTCGTP